MKVLEIVFLSDHSRLKGEIGEFHYKRVRHL